MILVNLTPKRRCSNCDKSAVRGHTRCATHSRINRESTKARTAHRKTLGQCVSCDAPAAPGRALCDGHLQAMRRNDQLRRDAAQETGRCQRGNCQLPIVEARLFCVEHLRAANERSSKHYQNFISQRRCKTCGELSQGKIRCVACTTLGDEERRVREAAREDDDHCLYCGELADRPLFTRTALTACSRCRTRLGYTGAVTARFKRARRSCIDRGWTLSFDEYKALVAQPCYYCGFLQDAFERGTGLDRRAPPRGYHIDNVVSCCGVCNVTRNSLYTVEEMKLLGEVVRQIKFARMARK